MVKLKNHRACVVGSRNIDELDRHRIMVIGELLAKLGVAGASGNALGSDKEWDNYIFVQHFLPWNGYNDGFETDDAQMLSIDTCPEALLMEARRIAEEHHPAWDHLKRGGRAMHTRNVFQALGTSLSPETMADLTIYTAGETPARVVKGGTRTAVEISRSYGIPTFNLRFTSDFEELKAILEAMLEN
ncbi:hypothetical protein DIREPILLOW8_59 [Vibrio phage Direpillow8]|uniref:Uncharacterized protein n=4 Tax=Thalassavirus TaxID=2948922 RepID=A0A6M4ES40_9CAUD|nr:DprA-like DNA recombination-mediator protein [Vibrio phage Achelous]YP_010102487.1 DprA-like DNA recombination-mediator protein [Vibrio phage Brizo]YP_010105648.1 DprA-like DNA recombination-mediator protein [Vibrio phage Bennett]YP_010105842.1 DprA-like DNA recombination-mediator protein [Vibrio phage Chester]QIG66178.1 hypothetical protein CILSICK_57 [Vibrio phage Cilsick]QKE60918.1 hypothetical protein DAX_57 [Vibrio phage Dax]QKN84524.1 hypothetical protein BBMUFFIN_58 [Vibrio phage BB